MKSNHMLTFISVFKTFSNASLFVKNLQSRTIPWLMQ